MLNKNAIGQIINEMIDEGAINKQNLRAALDDIIGKMVEGHHCALCGGRFVGRKERDTAMIVRRNRKAVAVVHRACWDKHNAEKS